MKRLLLRTVAVFLAGIISLSVFTICASAQTEESDSDLTYYKGAFYYRPGTGEYDPGADNVEVYTYSDDYFKHSGKEYDSHLATLSFALATASVSSARTTFTQEGYRRKNRNAVAFLEDTGFSDIVLNEDYLIKPTKYTMGAACAHKRIIDGGKEYTLLVILPRSAGYEAEWGDNFVLGEEGNAAGFDANAEKCLSFAKDYISQQSISGDIKVWTAGYSRGASVANLIAGKLIDAPCEYLGDSISLGSEDLYAYTCGTPLAADINNDPRSDKYAGIYNHFLTTELASAVAPADMGFDRYGTDHILYNEDNYDRMMYNLSVSNDYVHDTYDASINSKFFHPKKFSMVDGSIEISDDDDSYIPGDPAEYLAGLSTYLTEITGGREEYAKIYEQPLSDLIAYFTSLSAEQSDALISAFAENEDTVYLVVAMYAYFMKAKCKAESNYSKEQLTEKATELAALAAGADDLADAGIDSKTMALAAVKLGYYLLLDADKVKTIAAGYLSSILTEALEASGASQEELDALTDDQACLALTHIISHMFFGNIWQSDKVQPLQLDNEQTKAAATLIGNAANLIVDHINEIIIAWLKTEDKYYDDFTDLTDEQLTGYRRVYVRGAADNTLNGAILDENGSTVAVIENGAVKNSADRWIGFTSTDDGGFFRIPSGSKYQIRLNTAKPDTVTLSVGEYDLYEATTEMVFTETAAVKATDTFSLILPADDAEYQTAVAPGAESDILGDVDMNGEVEIVDSAWLLRSVSGFICLSDKQIALADCDTDGDATIMDATLIQRWLIGLKSDDAIGKPIPSAN